ncbi:hypothetical protein DFH09DRAFT_252532 [Mycena vulgaris]|nr:hypothetical protein DFH09DRAFT_252532 [Mycena vulgaris]
MRRKLRPRCGSQRDRPPCRYPARCGALSLPLPLVSSSCSARRPAFSLHHLHRPSRLPRRPRSTRRYPPARASLHPRNARSLACTVPASAHAQPLPAAAPSHAATGPRCCVLAIDCRAGGRVPQWQRAPVEMELRRNEGGAGGATGEQERCRGRRRRQAVRR